MSQRASDGEQWDEKSRVERGKGGGKMAVLRKGFKNEASMLRV